jgi:hypothetical protein
MTVHIFRLRIYHFPDFVLSHELYAILDGLTEMQNLGWTVFCVSMFIYSKFSLFTGKQHKWTELDICKSWWQKESKCCFVCLFPQFIHSFIHSIGMCRMRWFLAVLRSFFHSSLLYTFPSTLFHHLLFHPPSFQLTIYFLVSLSASLFANSYVILFWEFYFLPFSIHAQTNVSI